MLPVLMMRPHSFSIIAGSAALVLWKADERVMAIMASHLSSGNSWMGATCWMPTCCAQNLQLLQPAWLALRAGACTLLHNMSSAPKSRCTCLTMSLPHAGGSRPCRMGSVLSSTPPRQ